MLTTLALIMGLSPLYADHSPTRNGGAEVLLIDVAQGDLVDRLWRDLDLQAMLPVLRDEAVQEAGRIEAEGGIAGSGLPWAQVVGQIHDTDRMAALFAAGVQDALSRADRARVGQGLDFYGQGLGRRLVTLETTARRAMLDDEVEAQARAAFERAAQDADPRAEQILRLIDEADLVAPNVASGLNASLAFSRGFGDGGGFDMPLSDEQLMAETWAQQDQIEAEAHEWLQAFLMLAYSALTDAELEEYRRYATSSEGQALARVLFGSFDRVFEQTSYDMGLAAALRLQGRAL